MAKGATTNDPATEEAITGNRAAQESTTGNRAAKETATSDHPGKETTARGDHPGEDTTANDPATKEAAASNRVGKGTTAGGRRAKAAAGARPDQGVVSDDHPAEAAATKDHPVEAATSDVPATDSGAAPRTPAAGTVKKETAPAKKAAPAKRAPRKAPAKTTGATRRPAAESAVVAPPEPRPEATTPPDVVDPAQPAPEATTSPDVTTPTEVEPAATSTPTRPAEPVRVATAAPTHRAEPWAELLAQPAHAPELLALAAVQVFGPRAQDWADRTRAAYPKANDAALARLAIRQFTRFGGLASVFGAVAGSYAPVALLGSAAITQAELVLHVAAAYGLDPTDPERAAELLVIVRVHRTRGEAEAALAAAAHDETGGPAAAVWRLGRMIAAQAGGWTLLRFANRRLPGTSLLAAVLSSTASAQTAAARADAYYRKARKVR